MTSMLRCCVRPHGERTMASQASASDFRLDDKHATLAANHQATSLTDAARTSLLEMTALRSQAPAEALASEATGGVSGAPEEATRTLLDETVSKSPERSAFTLSIRPNPSSPSSLKMAEDDASGKRGWGSCGSFSEMQFTTLATSSASVGVFIYEGLAYNMVYLGRILPALDKQDCILPFAIIFNTVWLLAMWSYLAAHRSDPGRVPEQWRQFVRDCGDTLIVSPARLEWQPGRATLCRRCASPRPERAHHCHVCGICVLRMDHHCPWIYNCVGFRNFKYFFLLLFYTTIDCHFITWTMLESVKTSVESDTPFMTMFFLLFGETLAAFLGILVTCFFSFHVWLMLRGMTTIEFCEKSMKSNKSGWNGSAYDRGFGGNLRAVLGDNMLFWLLPMSPPSGRGLYYTEEDTRLNRDLEGGRGIRSRKATHKPRSSTTGAKTTYGTSSRKSSGARGWGGAALSDGSRPASEEAVLWQA
mmetsp:Transcript_28491/g.75437  ORF Transcript_28491/g.75437 Transcript_28491/m.75437 type:complete len:474 (+) Transcript_28491:3-1424(+)